MQKKSKVVCSLAVLAVLILVLVPLAVAQELPPTWKPPQIYKTASDTGLVIGDTVQFRVVVVNPGDPATDASWYNLRVTDNVHPALRVDSASSTRGTVVITGNQVVVNGGITLAPQEEIIILINCTAIGPVPPSGIVINTASLEYTDEEGEPQPIIEVEEPVVIIIEETPPVVPEASTLLLLGSAASGLAGYVGLQVRARRKRS